MPLFKYQGVSNQNKKTSGVIKADSLATAKDELRKNKVFITKIGQHKEKYETRSISNGMLISFTRDLSQLLRAGLPLYESLLAIEEKYKNHPSHSLFLEMCDQVKLGKDLSDVLTLFPKIFDQIYISMVRSAEETGSLDLVFSELEKLISRQQKLKKQIISALIYPLFLLFFCILVVNALFFFLIPSMEQLFEGRALHPMTETILSISRFMRDYGIFLASVSLLFSLFLFAFFSHRRGKVFYKALLLKLPLINKMTQHAVLTRFCRALSVMLKSSVSLVEGLSLAKRTMNHPSFEAIIDHAKAEIMQGGRLSVNLSKSPLIPSLVIRMVAISEETGNMSEMFQNIALIYEEELEKSLTRFTAMLQPVMLLFLAIVVGVVILSVLLPLTDVGSFLNT